MRSCCLCLVFVAALVFGGDCWNVDDPGRGMQPVCWLGSTGDIGKWESIAGSNQDMSKKHGYYNCPFCPPLSGRNVYRQEDQGLGNNELMNKDAQQPVIQQRFKIEWVSMANSCLLLALLMGSLAVILAQVMKNEFLNYTRIHEAAEELQENTRKWLLEDVFRLPSPSNVKSMMLGSETPFLALTLSIFFWTLFDVFRSFNHGGLLCAGMMLYALSPGMSGYVASSWYNSMGTTGSVKTFLTIGALFLAPQLLLLSYLNSVANSFGPSQTIPSGTIYLMFVLWSMIVFPFSVSGGVFGEFSEFNAEHEAVNSSNRSTTMMKYLRILPQVAIVGILPFSAFQLEFYEIFASAWGHKAYIIWFILFIGVCAFMLMAVTVVISLRYFQLSLQDRRLW